MAKSTAGARIAAAAREFARPNRCRLRPLLRHFLARKSLSSIAMCAVFASVGGSHSDLRRCGAAFKSGSDLADRLSIFREGDELSKRIDSSRLG